jgi:hypothetical protein
MFGIQFVLCFQHTNLINILKYNCKKIIAKLLRKYPIPLRLKLLVSDVDLIKKLEKTTYESTYFSLYSKPIFKKSWNN